MKKYIYYLLFTIYFFPVTCLPAEVNISASVDRSTLNFGDSVTLQVSVSGDAANMPKPSLPQLGEFRVYSSGTSQNISFVNGRVSSSLVYNYILSPNRPGKFVIGSVSIDVGGKRYSTNPINIDVLPAGNQHPQKQVDRQQLDVGDEKKQGIFVTAQLDKKRVFVNEGIIYTFRFFTSKNLASNPQYAPPNFTGFMTDDLPPQRTYQTTIDGTVYNVIEVKTQLFPTAPGKYNLGSASLQASVQDFAGTPFDGFFDDNFFKGFFNSGQPLVLKSKPLNLEVIPLPADKKPADFSGAVGNYFIRAIADRQNVGANNPVTVTVEISGAGNIKTISEPKIPALAGVRKYDTISSFNISKSGYKVSGSKSFKTVLIPEMPGELTIPCIEFSFFDSEKKEYREIKSSPIHIKVTASKAGSSTGKLSVPAAGVNVVGQDIRFIRTAFSSENGSRAADAFGDVLLIAACLILSGSFLYNRYNAFIVKNYDFIKSKRAYREFVRGVDRIDYKAVKIERFYGMIFELIIKYLSDKTKVAFGGLTFKEIEIILSNKRMPPENIKKIRDTLEEADFIRFTPSLNKKIDMKSAAEKIRSLVSEIEKGWEI